MCSNKRIRWAFGILVMLGLQCSASASVMLSGTRVILGEKARETSLPMKNTGTSPYVVQAWIDAGEGKNKTPLLVTPPLSRLDPGKENLLRIMRVGGELPADRESVFWLNVKEIPQTPTQENVLQVAIRSRLKVFYRPASLPGSSVEARTLLRWAVSAGPQGQGVVLKVGNASAYHVTLLKLTVNKGQGPDKKDQEELDAGMVPPFGELRFPLKTLKAPQAVQINFTTIHDYGGETPEEFVKVPEGIEPVPLKPEPALKPEAPSIALGGAQR
ncbi:fimbrial biogenesis chaperone [Variovorax sp. DAIF25]|uniref:fimbrial biogenesis chaperone n=1 Tax=Variovorax sp. DAIF25 TaxID=3080983 RepID=UPI003D6BC332